MYPFTFKLTWYSDYENEEKITYGCLFANSYAQAASIIEDHYKECLVSIDHLFAMEEANYIELPTETAMKEIEENN